nr:hypothetical protein [Tanacetum cinerariifolium]
MNMSQDRQTQNVGGNDGNQFRQYAGQVAHNQQGYNAWQNGRIQVAQNAGLNAGVQSGANQNGLVIVPGIANQSGSGNVVAARAEGTRMGNQARHPQLALSMTRLPSMTLTAQLSMVQSGGTVETSFAPNEETYAHQETVYLDQVAQVDMVNRNMRATNAELRSEFARYKNQEQRVEISQEKYDKLEKCYQKS